MNFAGMKCDECGIVKGQANGWHHVGVITGGQISLQLGYLYGPVMDSLGDRIPGTSYEIHDLCGEACFYRHIGKLLRIEQPTKESHAKTD